MYNLALWITKRTPRCTHATQTGDDVPPRCARWTDPRRHSQLESMSRKSNIPADDVEAMTLPQHVKAGAFTAGTLMLREEVLEQHEGRWDGFNYGHK